MYTTEAAVRRLAEIDMRIKELEADPEANADLIAELEEEADDLDQQLEADSQPMGRGRFDDADW